MTFAPTGGAGPLGAVVLVENVPGKTATPISVGVHSPSPSMPDAIFAVTQSVTIGSGSSGASGSATIDPLPLTTFPASLRPPPNTRFVITPAVYPAADPGADVLIGVPYVALTFGGGSPLNTLGAGPASFVLLPSSTYTNLAIGVVVRWYYMANLASGFSLPFTIQAVLGAVSP